MEEGIELKIGSGEIQVREPKDNHRNEVTVFL